MMWVDHNISRTWHRSVLGAALFGMGVLLTGTSAGAGSVDKTPFGNTQDGKAVDGPWCTDQISTVSAYVAAIEVTVIDHPCHINITPPAVIALAR